MEDKVKFIISMAENRFEETPTDQSNFNVKISK
jgi:hypothetical protein